VDEKIGVLPWSPLARGRLTRDWTEETPRTRTDVFGNTLYAKVSDADRNIVAAVATIAAQRGVPRAQVALAWLAQKPVVTAPIIGASQPEHLKDAIAALSLKLEAADIALLESAYAPRAIAGQT
jgi:aryl-alcohol dehydrogenase-like predicted oxidoreductase